MVESVSAPMTADIVVDPSADVLSGKKPLVDPSATAPERPSWLPEKFSAPEDLVKSYEEAQRKITELSQKPPDKVKGDRSAAGDKPQLDAEGNPIEQKPEEKAIKAGLNLPELEKEFLANNESLTPETLQKLADAGISADDISTYVEGRKAMASKVISEFSALAGNEEQMRSVLSWAQENLSPEEMAAYNRTLDAKNIPAAKLAFQGIISRYVAAEGKDPNLVTGATRAGTGDTYGSFEEVRLDMSKPEYHNDPSFRRKVEQKMARSTL